LCGLGIEGGIRKDRTGRKGHEVQAGTATSWNNGVGISVKPLLIAEIRDRRVDPHECVLVAGNGLELISLQRFVALDDGLAVYFDDKLLSLFFVAARNDDLCPFSGESKQLPVRFQLVLP
jgi:hypothetical protein